MPYHFSPEVAFISNRSCRIAVIASLALAAPHVMGQALPSETLPPSPVQQEIIRQILRQPVGPYMLEVQQWPEPYLARVADRLIRSNFQRTQRIVVRDQEAVDSPRIAPTTSSPVGGSRLAWLPIAGAVVVIAVIGLVLARGGRGSVP